MMEFKRIFVLNKSAFFIFLVSIVFSISSGTFAAANEKANTRAKQVFEHWTPQRLANAKTRDLVIDKQGNGYSRNKDGSLTPYGQTRLSRLSVKSQKPNKKPPNTGGSSGDSSPPEISNISPSDGTSIGSSSVFSATIIDDASGIGAVSFVVTYPDQQTTQSFNPAYIGNNNWEITLQGFSDGIWSWQVIAKDGASRGGNTARSSSASFTVNTGSTSAPPDDGTDNSYITENAAWTTGGDVQNAAGRIYFEMPGNSKRKGPWSGYVCSGTVVTDKVTGRSIILTASHCVYDDINNAFARNVLFIPNQNNTTGNGTDSNCGNDPIGCWAPSFGVVDINWTIRVFPENVAWDYAYYVVNDSNAHSGNSLLTDILDIEAGHLPISFTLPESDYGDQYFDSGDFTYALGYSYSHDPYFMYCTEHLADMDDANWWLDNCGLSGGSSGGPWIQPMDTDTGSGSIVSVNSWGYTNSPGMAGPKLSGTSAECLLEAAERDYISNENINTAGDAGIILDCF